MKKQVKHGKKKDSKPPVKGKTEKDPDDLVHSQKEEPPAEGEDLDDITHRSYKPQPGNIKTNDMEDPDDLVHRS